MPWSITEIHPLLIHFPIALFSTGLLLDISSHVLENDELETAGFYTMFMGLASSLFAIISGMIAFFVIGSISDIFHFHHGHPENPPAMQKSSYLNPFASVSSRVQFSYVQFQLIYPSVHGSIYT